MFEGAREVGGSKFRFCGKGRQVAVISSGFSSDRVTGKRSSGGGVFALITILGFRLTFF